MRVGIIGAGQLGQMLGYAARELGIECRFLDPAEKPPAASAGDVVRAAFDDQAALQALAEQCDVITYEFENVEVDALRALSATVPVWPPVDALRQAQDRLDEKALFESVGIPLPGYRRIDTRDDLEAAAGELGLPLVLKTRRFGYDGKGQFVVRTAAQIDEAWQTLGGRPLIAEAFVPFDFEVSVIGARGQDGSIVTWPLVRNVHKDGILSTSISPVDDDALSALAGDYMERLLSHLDYVGVLALELFVTGSTLLANEFAPRVHNSGHWTIEGSETSQFANHMLAVCGQDLDSTRPRGHAGMVNLIGTIPDAARSLSDDRATLHDYGKEPRPGRKLGHINVLADSAPERDEIVRKLLKTVT